MTLPAFVVRSLKILPLTIVLGLLLSCPLWAQLPPVAKEGRAAFQRGDYHSAYQLLQSLVLEHPGDPELDFFYGRSAYEIGDYESAVFAFDRVLIANPNSDRVRLELGRSYFALGEFESARASFEQVLAHQPPANVKSNIELYLQQIDQALKVNRFSGMLSLGLSYDNNVYVSPVDENIRTLTAVITLTGKNATPREDMISQNILTLNHIYRRHPRRPGWMTGLLLYNASYFEEQDLNLNLVGLSTGPIWSHGTWQGRLQGSFNYLTEDDRRYLTTAGLELEEIWRPPTPFSLGLSAGLSRLDYAESGRDATQVRLTAKPARSFGKLGISLDLGGEWSEAEDHQYSYLRGLVRLACSTPLSWKTGLTVEGRLQMSDYTGIAPIFGKKREDRLREATVGLNRVLWNAPSAAGQLRAQLTYTYTDTDSNIDLYKYNKQVLSFALSYLF